MSQPERVRGEMRLGFAPLGFLRQAGRLEQRLEVLMGARLALALVSLGIALGVDATLGDVDAPGRLGLYATVAFAFLSIVFYGFALPRIQRPERFAALNIASDIAIVSALVHFSGGPDSFFTFLYVLVAIYGALLFDRRGAFTTAVFGSLCFGGVLALARIEPAAGARPANDSVLATLWAIHAGAIVLAAALAGRLSAELRRTGEALRQRTSDLRALSHLHRRTVESLMSGLLTTDPQGRVTSWNPEAERITGLGADEAIGGEIDALLPGIRGVALERARTAPGHARTRMAYTNRRGEALHLGVGAYILRDLDGAPGGHVVIFQDVTDVVEMERELRRSERLAAVGALSASIAHEIRNPLAAISGSIQILRGREDAGRGAPEAKRLMDIVLRETDRLNALITDFLQYARPAPLSLQALRLEPLVLEVLEMLRSGAPEGLRLEAEVPGELAVFADPNRLRQVLWNLALNGCEAMGDGGLLRVTARAAGERAPQEGAASRRRDHEEKKSWVEISVADSGGGIPAEVLDRVFDPFFTTKPRGSGLGLATVHRIVEEHGGAIRLESAVGSGTVVTLRLPRAEGLA